MVLQLYYYLQQSPRFQDVPASYHRQGFHSSGGFSWAREYGFSGDSAGFESELDLMQNFKISATYRTKHSVQPTIHAGLSTMHSGQPMTLLLAYYSLRLAYYAIPLACLRLAFNNCNGFCFVQKNPDQTILARKSNSKIQLEIPANSGVSLSRLELP